MPAPMLHKCSLLAAAQMSLNPSCQSCCQGQVPVNPRSCDGPIQQLEVLGQSDLPLGCSCMHFALPSMAPRLSLQMLKARPWRIFP